METARSIAFGLLAAWWLHNSSLQPNQERSPRTNRDGLQHGLQVCNAAQHASYNPPSTAQANNSQPTNRDGLQHGLEVGDIVQQARHKSVELGAGAQQQLRALNVLLLRQGNSETGRGS